MVPRGAFGRSSSSAPWKERISAPSDASSSSPCAGDGRLGVRGVVDYNRSRPPGARLLALKPCAHDKACRHTGAAHVYERREASAPVAIVAPDERRSAVRRRRRRRRRVSLERHAFIGRAEVAPYDRARRQAVSAEAERAGRIQSPTTRRRAVELEDVSAAAGCTGRFGIEERSIALDACRAWCDRVHSKVKGHASVGLRTEGNDA
eukprot:729412-Prymnesium_polylepis.1